MSGWNGSQSGGAAKQPQNTPKHRVKSPSPVRWLVCGGLVVVGAALAAWWLLKPSDSVSAQSTPHSTPRTIKEVKPAAAPKPKEPTNAEKLRKRYPGLDIPKDWEKPYPPQAYWPDGRLKEHSRYVKVITNKPSRASMSVEELTFENHADRNIAGLLLVEPGEVLIGEREYGEPFVKHFLKSLEVPIVIDEENDTPFQKELKKAVIETRKDLKARYDAGEDIAQVMNESRQQLKELGLYREEIKKMVNDAKREHGDEFTEQDVQDLISAANKMLEERGCKPLRSPKMFIETVELQKDKE